MNATRGEQPFPDPAQPADEPPPEPFDPALPRERDRGKPPPAENAPKEDVLFDENESGR